MKKIAIIFLILFSSLQLMAASELDELDKPPEGAHEGQLLVGGFVTIGSALGQIPKAEYNFINDSTYKFPESDQTKALWLSHINFSFGITGEYIFLDHFGAKGRIKRTFLAQRTLFGANYQNWSYSLYRDFSFYVGPSVHLTTRKVWDVSLTPLIGFYTGVFQATPVAKRILKNDRNEDYTGESERSVLGFTGGSELAFTVYFSGGLFLSLGMDWTMSMIKFDKAFDLTNIQTGAKYSLGSNPTLHTLSLIITAGYAFYN